MRAFSIIVLYIVQQPENRNGHSQRRELRNFTGEIPAVINPVESEGGKRGNFAWPSGEAGRRAAVRAELRTPVRERSLVVSGEDNRSLCTGRTKA